MSHIVMILTMVGSIPSTMPQANTASLSVFSGIGMSAFDEDAIGDWDQCGYIPVGAQFTFQISPILAFGAEAETTLRDFSWLSGPDEEHTIRDKVAIAEFGVFGRVYITQNRISPYMRVGGAVYAGTLTEDDGEQEVSLDLDTQPGFNLGGGADYDVSDRVSVGLEGVYHIYSAAASNLPTVTAGWNFWAIRALAGITL